MGRKTNKPKWHELPSSERLARRAKSWGYSESVANRLRESGHKENNKD